jgi:aspartate 1-decarboxylase
MRARTLLRSKIHRATVTDANVDYEGSIAIDRDLMDAADIVEFEQVHVLDVDNGSRLVTYVIPAERGSGEICINGAAARLVDPGHLVIIVSYEQVPTDEVEGYRARVVHVDKRNRIAETVATLPSSVG